MAIEGEIRKNLRLQTVYQIVNSCIPLMTSPYLSRVLGAENLGVFSYTSSIAAYFSLIAMLGTTNYGTRSIAAVKTDLTQRSTVFWEIYLLQLIVSGISLTLYAGYVLLFCREYRLLFWIQSLSLISCLFDVNWLFFGVENFRLTVLRSTAVRIITVTAIFVFVKNPKDLWLYMLIMLGGTLLSQLILWRYVPGTVSPVRPRELNIFRHFQPNLILFVPLLAMSVYHIMDKTMLGKLSTYEQTGFYYNADKVINIPLGVINGIGTVMLPRMTALYKMGRQTEADRLLSASVEGVSAVCVAIGAGIAAISREFVPFFFGAGYDECVVLIIALSPSLLFKGISNTLRTQYLIPENKEKIFIQSVFCGAAVNLAVNVLLIPRLGALGAVIGTLAAEFVSCCFQAVLVCRVKRGVIPRSVLFYPCLGGLMFLAVRKVAELPFTPVLCLGAEILTGAMIYVGGCVLFSGKNGNIFFSAVFDR